MILPKTTLLHFISRLKRPAIYRTQTIDNRALFALIVGAVFGWGGTYALTQDKDNKKTVYYFGYGSNIDHDYFVNERFKSGSLTEDGWHKTGERVGPIPKDLGIFVLPNHQFSYSLEVSASDDFEPTALPTTAATVIPQSGKSVYGVVWEITPEQLKMLDKGEDVPCCYRKMALEVNRFGSSLSNPLPQTITAYVYVGNPLYLTSEINPHPDYVALIVNSAFQRHFPKDYIDEHLIPGKDRLLGRLMSSHD